MIGKVVMGLLLLMGMHGCSSKRPESKLPSPIWPYQFYERFNLRTILSSYEGDLRRFCATYPKDFFTPAQLYMPDTESIVIENNNRKLIFEFRADETLIVTDEVKDGSFKARTFFKIYYDEEHDDFRTDNLFVKKRENCQKYTIPDEGNVTK